MRELLIFAMALLGFYALTIQDKYPTASFAIWLVIAVAVLADIVTQERSNWKK